MISFGLFFGRTTVSAPLRLGPLTVSAPVETALGVSGLLACLLWLAWRSRDDRVRSLHRAAASSGVHLSRRPSAVDQRRALLGAGMVAVAVLAAAVVVPYAARGSEREVLRSAAGPELAVSSAVSPLAEYRGLFEDDRADDVLFTVTADGALPDRVRLATLDSYDGEIYRSGGTGALDQARFVRVPSTLDAGSGRAVDAEITIEELDGIWMPTVGQLASVEFTGARAASLADRFYYRSAAAAGVQTAGGGLSTGDAYRIAAVEPATPDLASIEAPGGLDESVDVPQSLRTWVDEHASGSGGAALAGLVGLLRERGYLSHALAVGDDTPLWMQSLADYTFQPSASGHSLARIDAMFARLLERETDPRAAASENYVAAVGDDEQFAAAVALVARELGFPSRVVVGARLASSDPALRTCEAGVCRAQDLAAWTEVQSAAGDWVAVDVTPQYDQSPSLEVTEQRNPENVTEVRPDPVEDVVPPDPVQEDSGADDRADDARARSTSRGSGPSCASPGSRCSCCCSCSARSWPSRRPRPRGAGRGARRAIPPRGWRAAGTSTSMPPSIRGATRRRCSRAASSPTSSRRPRGRRSRRMPTAPSSPAIRSPPRRQRRSGAPSTRSAGGSRGDAGSGARIVATVSLRSFVRHLAPSGVRSRFAERGSVGYRRPRTSP